MKIIAPDYHRRFRCIADRCVHSCCIGWEIDIDEESREKYRRIPGPFGERLNAAIADEEEGASFRLGKDERCPLLNKNGLCDLITQCGEEALCQICADHPRFRNFFTDRTEIGLGLCCEAAAFLVLGQEEPVRFLPLEDDGLREPLPEEEQALLSLRDTCIGIMQDRGYPVDTRLELLLAHIGEPVRLIPEDWREVYRDLNRLDPAWDEALDLLHGEGPAPALLETVLEQWGVYLLYRHLPGALEDGDLKGRVKFCVLSVRMLAALCRAHAEKYGTCTLADCAEYARMYSAEIEYDEDNVNTLLDALAE